MTLLHEDAGAVGADLAGRVEIAEHGAADGAFDIGIVEDDHRRLAAELHRHMLDAGAGRGHTLRPVGTEPVSETLATSGWSTSAAPTSRSPWTTLKTPFGQAGLDEDFGDLQRRRAASFPTA